MCVDHGLRFVIHVPPEQKRARTSCTRVWLWLILHSNMWRCHESQSLTTSECIGFSSSVRSSYDVHFNLRETARVCVKPHSWSFHRRLNGNTTTMTRLTARFSKSQLPETSELRERILEAVEQAMDRIEDVVQDAPSPKEAADGIRRQRFVRARNDDRRDRPDRDAPRQEPACPPRFAPRRDRRTVRDARTPGADGRGNRGDRRGRCVRGPADARQEACRGRVERAGAGPRPLRRRCRSDSLQPRRRGRAHGG